MFFRYDKEYTRLPETKVSWLRQHSLWLAKDHLLSVRTMGFTEYYKRFYYNDIQSIVIQRNSISVIRSGIFGLFCLISLLAAMNFDNFVKMFFYLTGLFFFLIFLINIFRGPSCVCYLSTAVQTEKLLSLNRLRIAEKAVNYLRYYIENAQGSITPQMIENNLCTKEP